MTNKSSTKLWGVWLIGMQLIGVFNEVTYFPGFTVHFSMDPTQTYNLDTKSKTTHHKVSQ